MSNSVSRIVKIFCCFVDIGHVRTFLSLLCDKLKLNLTWMLNQGFGFWLKAIGMRVLSQQPSLYNLENEKSFNVFSELAHISTLAQVTEMFSLASWKKNDRKFPFSGYDVVQWFLDRHRDQLWEGPSWPSDISFAYSFAGNWSLRFFWPARWADTKWSEFSCYHLWDFTFHSLASFFAVSRSRFKTEISGVLPSNTGNVLIGSLESFSSIQPPIPTWNRHFSIGSVFVSSAIRIAPSPTQPAARMKWGQLWDTAWLWVSPGCSLACASQSWMPIKLRSIIRASANPSFKLTPFTAAIHGLVLLIYEVSYFDLNLTIVLVESICRQPRVFFLFAALAH